MKAHDAAYWKIQLSLDRHPEGGWYRQTYSAGESIPDLPPRFGGPRAFSSAIYFLLEGSDFSALHRIASDEVWHLYAASPDTSLAIHSIDAGGILRTDHLGAEPELGQSFQVVVPAGAWFGAKLIRENGAGQETATWPVEANRSGGTPFVLVGCTVAPGFHFDDFELAGRDDLLSLYPRYREIILSLTR